MLDQLKVPYIDANREAARSVVLKGRVSVTRKLVTPAVDPAKSDASSRRPAFEIKGPFTFMADDSGRRKRWNKTYEPKGFGVDEARALDGDVVRDAANVERGYLRPTREFLAERSDNLDFYRDHWFSEDIEPLGTVIRFIKDHPDQFGIRDSPGRVDPSYPGRSGRARVDRLARRESDRG